MLHCIKTAIPVSLDSIPSVCVTVPTLSGVQQLLQTATTQFCHASYVVLIVCGTILLKRAVVSICSALSKKNYDPSELAEKAPIDVREVRALDCRYRQLL